MEIGKQIKTKFNNPQHKALVNIRFTSNWMAKKQNTYMSKFGISMAQFNILRILRGAKDFLNVSVIKERMVEVSPNTTRLMDKLIEKELIKRVRLAIDKRVVRVKITKKGLNLLAEIDTGFNQILSFSENISNEEAEILSSLLDKLRN